MKIKIFSSNALAAIEAEEGQLYEAIIDAYVARKNILEEDDEEDRTEEDVRFTAAFMLQNFAAPKHISFLYGFYEADLPHTLSIGGAPTPILELDHSKLVPLTARFQQFDRLFNGRANWNSFAQEYHRLTGKRMHIEELAIRWITGSGSEADFMREYAVVKGFDGQLLADTGVSQSAPSADGASAEHASAAPLAVAIIAGILWAFVFWVVGLMINAVFTANRGWITGIGVALMVFAAPKVRNALIVVPTAIITYCLLTATL